MPTLIFFLARMGIITAKWMVKNFKYAVLAVFVIAAVITPSPDMVNQLIPRLKACGAEDILEIPITKIVP
jgi:Sec-independent protein secretion pathway component TatC